MHDFRMDWSALLKYLSLGRCHFRGSLHVLSLLCLLIKFQEINNLEIKNQYDQYWVYHKQE